MAPEKQPSKREIIEQFLDKKLPDGMTDGIKPDAIPFKIPPNKTLGGYDIMLNCLIYEAHDMSRFLAGKIQQSTPETSQKWLADIANINRFIETSRILLQPTTESVLQSNTVRELFHSNQEPLRKSTKPLNIFEGLAECFDIFVDQLKLEAELLKQHDPSEAEHKLKQIWAQQNQQTGKPINRNLLYLNYVSAYMERAIERYTSLAETCRHMAGDFDQLAQTLFPEGKSQER